MSSEQVPIYPRSDETYTIRSESSALGAARTLLASQPWPLVLFFNAYSTHPVRLLDTRASLEELLLLAGRSSKRFRVILAVPALAVCLFRDEDGLRRLFGDAVTPERLLRARFEPDVVVAELLATRQKTWNVETVTWLVNSLDRDLLRQDPAVQELLQFLDQVLAIPAA